MKQLECWQFFLFQEKDTLSDEEGTNSNKQIVSNISVIQGIKISLMFDLVLLKYSTPRMTIPTAAFLYFVHRTKME